MNGWVGGLVLFHLYSERAFYIWQMVLAAVTLSHAERMAPLLPLLRLGGLSYTEPYLTAGFAITYPNALVISFIQAL